MCGIAATCGLADGGERVPRMLDRLAHRGPDDEGLQRIGPHWLGHRRLAIVDLAGGRQPLVTADGHRSLVANGEIYNHASLRELTPAGRYLTASDNEVLLHLVEAAGPDGLGLVRGMFAFAAAGSDGSFIAARDPVGIKPLYWWRDRDRDRAVFGSELGAFDADLRDTVEPFPPGCWWSPSQGLRRFADAIPPALRTPGEASEGEIPDDVPAELRTHVIAAVGRRLMSDVTVGVFLSGGLDSSLIAAVATRLGGPMPSFAVGLADSADLLAAREVAESLGTEHHEVVVEAAELVDAVPHVVRRLAAFDPGLVRSAVANDRLAAATARHVKVVLTGEGADECFAGYHHLAALSPADLHSAQCQMIDELHRLNLQRADHLTMAHGLEARVPFLDRDLIAFALGLPPQWRAPRDGMTKHLLRSAFAGWLPASVLWRRKEQFGDGSGVASVLRESMAATVTDEELTALRRVAPVPLRNAEEAAYYRIFAAEYGAGTTAQVAQFATTSEPGSAG